MKVNITGKGRIPYVGAVAPVRGIEVDIQIIRQLLNVPKFQVFDSATGVFISRANVESFAEKVAEEEKPVAVAPSKKPAKKEKKVEVKPEPVVEAPVVEETPVVKEPVKEEYVAPAVEVVEETPVETVEEAPATEEVVVEASEETAEETPVEESTIEAPKFNGYNGKKKKHH